MSRSDRRLERRRLGDVFDLDADDAMAVHLQHGVTSTIVFKALAAIGNLAELRHYEAGQGLKPFFARKHDIVLRLQIAQVR